jgi:hypothetical protein
VGKLDSKCTPIRPSRLDAAINQEWPGKPARATYRNPDGSAAGAMMVRIVLLQSVFGVLVPQAEKQPSHRISFRRFTGLRWDGTAPDKTTLVKVRARLCETNLDRWVFDSVGRSIERHSLEDASGDDLTTGNPDASFTQ